MHARIPPRRLATSVHGSPIGAGGQLLLQHAVAFGPASAKDDLQPHPGPPVDRISASRAQHASVPAGAAPPQHALGAGFWGVIVVLPSKRLSVIVWTVLAFVMSGSW